MSLTPLYVVPLLVEQSTWGGNYIAQFKHLTQPEVTQLRIGQSFELASDSILTSELGEAPAFGLAPATDLAHPQWFNQPQTQISISDLIAQDPVRVLGQAYLDKHGQTFKILIKFTQAQNNSFQVHVKPGQEFSHWLAKPESWYYFETGRATLGLAPAVNLDEYQARVAAIDAFAHSLSQQIGIGLLSVETARQQLAAMIDQDHPRRFVNTITVQPHQVIELAAGGIHHSWETGVEAPNGNILYEVQVDVRDEHCTLRAFDQGNIKADGAIRPLTIDDYFTALDRDPEHNLPQQYLSSPLSEPSGLTTNQAGAATEKVTLFANDYYQTQLISVQPTRNQTISMADSFHHLFAQTGAVTVQTEQGTWILPPGWSLFLPAAVGQYSLESAQAAQVLVTSI